MFIFSLSVLLSFTFVYIKQIVLIGFLLHIVLSILFQLALSLSVVGLLHLYLQLDILR